MATFNCFSSHDLGLAQKGQMSPTIPTAGTRNFTTRSKISNAAKHFGSAIKRAFRHQAAHKPTTPTVLRTDDLSQQKAPQIPLSILLKGQADALRGETAMMFEFHADTNVTDTRSGRADVLCKDKLCPHELSDIASQMTSDFASATTSDTGMCDISPAASGHQSDSDTVALISPHTSLNTVEASSPSLSRIIADASSNNITSPLTDDSFEADSGSCVSSSASIHGEDSGAQGEEVGECPPLKDQIEDDQVNNCSGTLSKPAAGEGDTVRVNQIDIVKQASHLSSPKASPSGSSIRKYEDGTISLITDSSPRGDVSKGSPDDETAYGEAGASLPSSGTSDPSRDDAERKLKDPALAQIEVGSVRNWKGFWDKYNKI